MVLLESYSSEITVIVDLRRVRKGQVYALEDLWGVELGPMDDQVRSEYLLLCGSSASVGSSDEGSMVAESSINKQT